MRANDDYMRLAAAKAEKEARQAAEKAQRGTEKAASATEPDGQLTKANRRKRRRARGLEKKAQRTRSGEVDRQQIAKVARIVQRYSGEADARTTELDQVRLLMAARAPGAEHRGTGSVRVVPAQMKSVRPDRPGGGRKGST